METLIAWLGFVAIFGTLMYGADKSMKKSKKSKYVKINKYTSEFAQYVPVR